MKSAARRYGVLDPLTLLAKLRGFAQPSEVGEPMELLRAGILFHARGLVNTKAIQHNLDWIWPYWVERQFDPADESFIPRAFSFSHINLSHRNWTAVGEPQMPIYPLVDPRGLMTPLHDGWSLDFWLITDGRRRLLPSKLEEADQVLGFDPTLNVTTSLEEDGLKLTLMTYMENGEDGNPEAKTMIGAKADEDAWLAIAIRPYNPEGVQFIHRIEQLAPGNEIRVNNEATVRLGRRPDSIRMAHYAEGDVYLDVASSEPRKEVTCSVGMATAAALYRIRANEWFELTCAVTLERDLKAVPSREVPRISWDEAISGVSTLKIADEKMQFLYDAAVRTVLLLSADELVPGPYTYRRFWFRDACLMLHPLLAMGLTERARRILSKFPERQTLTGYFLSQEGEWDSNGQVLWIMARYSLMTGERLTPNIEDALKRAVRWLERKRLKKDEAPGTKGLLPAGFSAEHLGPNDYYYWDNYWALGGLKGIAAYWRRFGEESLAVEAENLADLFSTSIESSIRSIPLQRARGGIPAAPGRRMDAGAVGSMVADYPLQIYPPSEGRMMRTTDFLMDRCFSNGGFFQQMIHSGINAYLTLDLAQTLLRAGDARYADLIRSVARLASPTGQWPEAIHPRTFGGCMGDGQHGWAAAEWIMMIRNCFVREEQDALLIGTGILPEWRNNAEISFGPTLTAWGDVSVALNEDTLKIDATWRNPPPKIRVKVPGYLPLDAGPDDQIIQLQPL